MIRTFRVIKNNWSNNHRYHGGARAVSRCLFGTLALRAGLVSANRSSAAQVTFLTFSVVPWMTTLWGRLLNSALVDRSAEILIGDCSGGIGGSQRTCMADHRARWIPCLNEQHGRKIDLFLAKLCRGPYVVVADDDVFWLSDEPLKWALLKLELDSRIAAVSLLPRYTVSDVLRNDNLTQAMGSHCLVIRRELFEEQQLSFAVRPAPPGVDWFYDTGDFANRELVRRGFRVVVAEQAIQNHLADFDGVSSWMLKFQGKSPEQLAATVAGIPARQQKALQAVFVARGLAALIRDHALTAEEVQFLSASRLAAFEETLVQYVSPRLQMEIRGSVEKKLKRIGDTIGSSR